MKMITKPERAQERPRIWTPLQAGSGRQAVDGRQWQAGSGGRQWMAGSGKQAVGGR